jgi:hypothetical protein
VEVEEVIVDQVEVELEDIELHSQAEQNYH